MLKLSNGNDSTLGNYRDIASAVYGEHSHVTAFLDEKIKNNPNARDEEVIADEGQMMLLLAALANKDN